MDLIPVMKTGSSPSPATENVAEASPTPTVAIESSAVVLATSKQDQHADAHVSATPEESRIVDYYTCPMHPAVRLKGPNDKCPICGMNAVPIYKATQEVASEPAPITPGEMNHEHAEASPAAEAGVQPPMGAKGHDHAKMLAEQAAKKQMVTTLNIPVERQQQIGVTFASVERQHMRHSIRAVGMIEPSKALHWEFVARVDGYVEKLFVTSPGELVEEGQPLMSIYSPDLRTAEHELVSLLKMRDKAGSGPGRETAERLVDSAKRRLEQWNITPEQIKTVEKTREPQDSLTLLSPFKGLVEAVPVDQGRNVKVGDHLVDVVDISTVWIWAEFFETELSMLEPGQDVIVTSKSYPNEQFKGKVAVINPFLDVAKRTTKVRVDIANPNFRLKPGMYANVELQMDMGEALTIPVSAIMPTGTRNIVFVDRGAGKLEPRLVELGTKYGDNYEVTAGVKEGERVVASANFLIDAEAKIQGALKAFEEQSR
jgi:Cu(I)/Ag(I) efflux system membrane fusion protein